MREKEKDKEKRNDSYTRVTQIANTHSNNYNRCNINDIINNINITTNNDQTSISKYFHKNRLDWPHRALTRQSIRVVARQVSLEELLSGGCGGVEMQNQANDSEQNNYDRERVSETQQTHCLLHPIHPIQSVICTTISVTIVTLISHNHTHLLQYRTHATARNARKGSSYSLIQLEECCCMIGIIGSLLMIHCSIRL
ncbi:MAG: hypothetical protein EZS28_050841 [Streblomastix strix]|uniref:Uncharacterized protein n=1 Tax=Streblomastix strix TaxID=222440 RepID=A0A5J4T6M1_9EUKA|nr:MAG: hypothetical protein EZS28_050841 [Streblomastix strix]